MAESAPVSKQELRSDISRQKILKAAVHIIQTEDISKLNVRNICKAAGLSTGAFYHLFNSKEDVINYYLNYTFKQYKKEINTQIDGLDPSERIRTISRYMVMCYKQAGYKFMSYFYQPTNPMLDYRNRPEHMILEEVRVFLEGGLEQGFYRDDLDIDEAMLGIATIVTGTMFYWCVFKGDLDADAIIDRRLKEYLTELEN